MFAVVEFIKKTSNQLTRECAVIPLLWMTANHSKCYWPRVTTEEQFINMAKNQVLPDEKQWKLYDIHKKLYVCGR